MKIQRVCILPMRDWNTIDKSSGVQCPKFVSYLWGIETHLQDCICYFFYMFVSYLWGIETMSVEVPLIKTLVRLYLTYEGLKPFHGGIRCHQALLVCILPMRDWNSSIDSCMDSRVSLFVSYLWGIETMFGASINVPKSTVCILPMRDWNFFLLWVFAICHHKVSILPMRDWNSKWCGDFCSTQSSFLSYLWGIETLLRHLLAKENTTFLSYLWGIETRWNPKMNRLIWTLFLSYLWGIETFLWLPPR